MKLRKIENALTVIRRKEGIIFTSINDTDTVMMDTNSGKYFGMHEIAREIWELIEQPVTIGTICRELEVKYEITHEACLKDVLSFSNDMLKHKLIEID